MDGMAEILRRWPGKSPLDPGGVEHPAVLHMLDVAAVAERLLAPLPDPEPLRQALVLLCALHDLGKIGESFRAALREGRVQTFRHWEITEALLWQHDALLEEAIGGDDVARDLLYGAVAGHHGHPSLHERPRGRSGPAGDWKRMLDAAGPQAVEDAAEVIRAFAALWPSPPSGRARASTRRGTRRARRCFPGRSTACSRSPTGWDRTQNGSPRQRPGAIWRDTSIRRGGRWDGRCTRPRCWRRRRAGGR